MSKKKKIIILISAGLLLALIIGLIIFFTIKKTPASNRSQSLNLMGGEQTTTAQDLFFEDEAGFSFYYPQGITVSDETPDDNIHYTKLILTKDSEELTIVVKDTNETKIEDYLKKDLELKTASLYGATNLGEMSAKQYANGNDLFTIAIDQGVLYLIQGPKDGDFWEKAQNLIADSFAFKGQEKTTTSGTSNNVIYEEEEVIE